MGVKARAASSVGALAEAIEESGKTLKAVVISHAHPDHFMGVDVITERFPQARIVSTPGVAADLRVDGPWIFKLLREKLGAEGPQRLVTAEALSEPTLSLDGATLEIAEFGEGEARHMACLLIPDAQALLCADMVYNGAHLYLREHRLEAWLARLDEFEAFASGRGLTIYPGHGPPGDLTLVAKTRAYLNDFAEAVGSGDAKTAEQRMLARYPDYRVRQFLTLFSLPAYFPSG